MSSKRNTNAARGKPTRGQQIQVPQSGRSKPGSSGARKVVGQYMLGKTIGEGTFGKVKLAVHLPTGEKVAVKILEKSRIKEQADVRRVNREIKILKKSRHANIVQLYEVLDTQNSIYLMMENCEGGELFDYIVAARHVPEPQACKFFHQIINGIEACHLNEVTHRDMKPENLLLKAHKDGWIVKIVDFGLSNTHEGGKLLSTACGSPCYAAPEMIAGKKYVGPMADMWSIGVILFALVCGFLPFEDSNTTVLYKKILSGDYKPAKWISADVKDLISKILETDPTRRYGISEVRQHRWYNLINESEVPKETGNQDKGLLSGDAVTEEVMGALTSGGFDVEKIKESIRSKAVNAGTAMYYLLEQKHRVAVKKKMETQAKAGAAAAAAGGDGNDTTTTNAAAIAAANAAMGIDTSTPFTIDTPKATTSIATATATADRAAARRQKKEADDAERAARQDKYQQEQQSIETRAAEAKKAREKKLQEQQEAVRAQQAQRASARKQQQEQRQQQREQQLGGTSAAIPPYLQKPQSKKKEMIALQQKQQSGGNYNPPGGNNKPQYHQKQQQQQQQQQQLQAEGGEEDDGGDTSLEAYAARVAGEGINAAPVPKLNLEGLNGPNMNVPMDNTLQSQSARPGDVVDAASGGKVRSRASNTKPGQQQQQQVQSARAALPQDVPSMDFVDLMITSFPGGGGGAMNDNTSNNNGMTMMPAIDVTTLAVTGPPAELAAVIPGGQGWASSGADADGRPGTRRSRLRREAQAAANAANNGDNGNNGNVASGFGDIPTESGLPPQVSGLQAVPGSFIPAQLSQQQIAIPVTAATGGDGGSEQGGAAGVPAAAVGTTLPPTTATTPAAAAPAAAATANPLLLPSSNTSNNTAAAAVTVAVAPAQPTTQAPSHPRPSAGAAAGGRAGRNIVTAAA